MAYVLLTGATGLVGGYLLRNLLRKGIPIAVLVRPTPGADVRRRIETVLEPFETEAGRALPRPVILQGALDAPGLGLSESDRRFLREQCDTILNSAASIEFYRDPRSDEPFRTNVRGLQNLLETCRREGIKRFHHLSTAYVAGLRTGRVLESEGDVGQAHGNDYEQSKLTGERLVYEAGFPERPTMYRPSIVLGDSKTGYTTTYNGFYTPLQLAAYLHKQGEIAGDWQAWYLAQLGLSGEERKNLVPVDWVAECIVELFLNPASHGGTYHLTNPHPPTARQLTRVMQKAITAQIVPVKRAVPRSDLADAGAEFQRYMSNYRAYFRDDPAFDDSARRKFLPHLPCPACDDALLERTAHFALRKNFTPPRFTGELSEHDFLASFVNFEIPSDGAMAAGDYRVSLTGRGGGDYVVTIDPLGKITPERGTREPIAAGVRLRFDLWQRLIAGEVSLASALRQGRVMITGTPEHARSAERLLETLRAAAARSAAEQRSLHAAQTAAK